MPTEECRAMDQGHVHYGHKPNPNPKCVES